MEFDGCRVHRVTTLIFSNPGPSTKLLIQVINDRILDHRSSNPLVTNTCRLRSVLVVGLWLVLTYMRTPPTHCYLESSEQVAYMKTHP